MVVRVSLKASTSCGPEIKLDCTCCADSTKTLAIEDNSEQMSSVNSSWVGSPSKRPVMKLSWKTSSSHSLASEHTGRRVSLALALTNCRNLGSVRAFFSGRWPLSHKSRTDAFVSKTSTLVHIVI